MTSHFYSSLREPITSCFQAAFVERLDGRDLFDSLYAEDVEGQKLNTMPGVPDLHEEYGKKFQGKLRNLHIQNIPESGLVGYKVDWF